MIPVSSLKDVTEDARLELDMMESIRKMRCKEIERRALEIWKEKDRFFKNRQENEGKSQRTC